MSFLLNLHELPRRAGEYRSYELELHSGQEIGIPMLAIAANDPIEVSVNATSVDEGVLIRGKVKALARGECSRCLDPISFAIEQNFDELYEYESKAAAINPDEIDTDEILVIKDDCVDLAVPIRDAVVLALPINPLCQEDCQGLCPGCGEYARNLPADHEHLALDPRWSALSELADKFEREQEPEQG
jgi:uncharacterized protein